MLLTWETLWASYEGYTQARANWYHTGITTRGIAKMLHRTQVFLECRVAE